MQTAFLLSSLVLGLLGGTHCLAMCGPACVAIHARDNPAEKPLVFTPKKEAAQAGFTPKIAKNTCKKRLKMPPFFCFIA